MLDDALNSHLGCKSLAIANLIVCIHSVSNRYKVDCLYQVRGEAIKKPL